MICSTCRRSQLFRLSSSKPSTSRLPSVHTRFITTVPTTPNAAPVTPFPSSPAKSNPVTSSSTPGISQPLSQPHSLSVKSSTSTTPKIKSSIPGGQELRGLGYLKSKPSILAKEDDQYPEWLWTLLETDSIGKAGDASRVDVAAMTKKQRAKYDRKQERLSKNLIKPIPVHEQSQNLTQPGDDAVISQTKRQEITKSSREARRKGIRENNFLKSL